MPKKSPPIRLNLGCGRYPLPGFINIDNRKEEGVDRVVDITKGLPYENNSVDEIHAGHIIEHFELEASLSVLQDCFRVLRPGGIITVVSPDLEYFKNKAIEQFNYYIFSNEEDGFHRSAWTSNDLIRYMEILGFEDIKEVEDSPHLTAQVPWQFIVVGKKGTVSLRDYTVSIIIVTRNSKEYITQCIQSIVKASKFFNINYEIVLVDNNSSDGTIELVKNRFPQVRTITNTTNRGFAAANNQGAKESHGKYILFLNPDTEVALGAIETMANYLEKSPQVGAVCALLLNQCGEFSQTEQRYFRKYPSILQTVLLDTPLHKLSLRSNFLKKHVLLETINGSRPTFVKQIPGACFMMRREQFHEFGEWDEHFPLYFEDVDLSYRIHKRGFKLCVLPDARVFHIGGTEVGRLNPTRNRLQFFSSQKLFFRKHYGLAESKLLFSIVTLLHIGYLLYQLLKDAIKQHPMRKKIIGEEKLFLQLWMREWKKNNNWIENY